MAVAVVAVAACSSFTLMNIGGSPLFDPSRLYYTYTLSALLALIILSLAYSRFRGLFGPDNKNMSLTVKWGRERFVVRPFSSLFDWPLTCLAFTVLLLIPLLLSTRPNFRLTAPSLQIPLPPLDTKLSVLRQTLSEHTHLPPNAFKLIYAGAVMKDDDAPRKSFLPMIIRHFRLPLPSTPDSAVFPHSSVPHHSLLVNCLQSHV